MAEKGEATWLFSPAQLGNDLKEVAADMIRTEGQDIVSRWFHSEKDADVYIWLDKNNNIIKQQVTFFGQVAEWNILEGVKTGFIFEEENPDETKKNQATEVVYYDEGVQKSCLQQAMQVLQNAMAVKQEERQALLSNFKNGPQADLMDPEEFLRKFSPQAWEEEYAEKGLKRFAQKLESWWRRLLNRKR